MAFCSKCGSEVMEGAVFCGKCGNSIASAATPPPPPIPAAAASSGLSSNIAAALSYFFITAIIFLVTDQFKSDRFVRFHSFQSIAYGVVVTLFSIVWSAVLGGVGGFFWTLISLVHTLISLAIFIFWILLMYKAYNNETYKLPVIGDWAEKQAAK
jgi:uncharacterized membrane protein